MALHTRDGGLVMPNAWGGLSALMLADAGFEAIATSSAALAATLGRSDGRHEVIRGEHLGRRASQVRAARGSAHLRPPRLTSVMPISGEKLQDRARDTALAIGHRPAQAPEPPRTPGP
ncbi:isocitrate lyase/phosphoenolpyruvate mutase family protein [Streptomyces sp. NPDC046900]|uniref:isocitrate lyase/phosphoenolpyruvate mutase family protein n=1 Tax=Streptomyces sp. NPDC046900 TaxID=3155473 RepID=UPI0033C7D5A5